MSVDAYFLLNQLADFSLLAAVSRSLGCFRLRRALMASALAALYAVLARFAPTLSAWPWQLGLLPIVTALCVGRTTRLTGMTAALSLATTAIATGVCFTYRGAVGFEPLVLLLPWLLTLAPRVRREALAAVPATVEVANLGRVRRFPACVDTGNRLTEPFSGQPVLIASEELLGDMLPDRGLRRVAYGSVGGVGTLRCFRPEALKIIRNGRRQRTPEAWIAVYPGRLPGAYQALAPAAFLFS